MENKPHYSPIDGAQCKMIEEQEEIFQPKNFSILAVDDSKQSLNLLEKILLKQGYQLHLAESGPEALSLLEVVDVDLILLDLIMPGMDGFETFQEIKKCIPGPPSVIFVTANNDQQTLSQAFEAGAIDFIGKPYSANELSLRIKAHLSLQHVTKQLERKNQAHRELLQVLCHDLQNPLGSIFGFAEVLENKPDYLAEFLPYITRAALGGLDVIDLVRNFRSFEEKTVQLENISLAEVARDLPPLLDAKLRAKGIKLHINLDEDLIVRAERTSLVHSVLANLLTNAIKFSHRDKEVVLGAHKEGGRVRLWVEDQGIGIPERILRDLFDVTKKTNRPGTEQEGGTGFGMPLVKRFVELYGGTMEIESRDHRSHPSDHGTKISLLLV